MEKKTTAEVENLRIKTGRSKPTINSVSKSSAFSWSSYLESNERREVDTSWIKRGWKSGSFLQMKIIVGFEGFREVAVRTRNTVSVKKNNKQTKQNLMSRKLEKNKTTTMA